jgi:plasmid stabilization system protein ParE
LALRIEYADEARGDLIAIARQSRAQWGEAHARAFFEGLEQSIAQLAALPHTGQPADDIRKGLRRRVYRALTIFYTLETDSLRILAVLHGRQDAPSTLENRP